MLTKVFSSLFFMFMSLLLKISSFIFLPLNHLGFSVPDFLKTQESKKAWWLQSIFHKPREPRTSAL